MGCPVLGILWPVPSSKNSMGTKRFRWNLGCCSLKPRKKYGRLLGSSSGLKDGWLSIDEYDFLLSNSDSPTILFGDVFWRYCKPLPGRKWTHVWVWTPKHVGRVWTWWQLYSIGNKQIHQWILGYPYTNHIFNEHSPLFCWHLQLQDSTVKYAQDGMCRCIAHFLWNGRSFIIVGRCWMQKLVFSEILGNHNKLPIVYKLMFPIEIAKKSWDIWFFILGRPNVQRSAGNHVTWTQWVAIVAWNLWMGCHLVGSGRNAGGIIPIEQVETDKKFLGWFTILRLTIWKSNDRLNALMRTWLWPTVIRKPYAAAWKPFKGATFQSSRSEKSPNPFRFRRFRG